MRELILSIIKEAFEGKEECYPEDVVGFPALEYMSDSSVLEVYTYLVQQEYIE